MSRKITTGLIGIIAVLVVGTGIAFAAFTSTASVTGLNLSTATPGLLISGDGSTFESSLDASSLSFAQLVPGESDWGEIWLQNSSDGTTDPVDFDITGQIISAGGDWASLKDEVWLRICVYDATAELHCDLTNTTDWLLISEWNLAAKDILPVLEQGETMHYAINLMLDGSADNSVAGKTITNINFDFVGTQVD